MRRLFSVLFITYTVLSFCSLAAADDALYKDIYSRYPRSSYIVGIGETQSTESALRDRRVAEVMARRELAAQIRMEVSEVAIDIACSGGAKDIVGAGEQCRDQFSSVLETRVDEFIQGSSIVEHGEYEGRAYAVAVMEKAASAQELRDEADRAAAQASEEVERARAGDSGARERAREEYLRARALAAQGDALEGVRERAAKKFEELEREIRKLGGQ
jgi:hypothetical protein